MRKVAVHFALSHIKLNNTKLCDSLACNTSCITAGAYKGRLLGCTVTTYSQYSPDSRSLAIITTSILGIFYRGCSWLLLPLYAPDNQWRSQDLLSSGAQNGRPCAPAKILKPRPFPVKIASARERCTISLDVDQPKISMQAKKLML